MITSTRIPHLLLTLVLLAGSAASSFAAQAYIIVDSRTGHVLREQKSRDKRQVGSLTKVATAMVVLDWAEKHGGDLSQLATIPPEAFAGTGENNIGFEPGDTIQLRDALSAALIQSDNVAAYTLAHHVGQALQALVPATGTPVATFVGQMNALARTLGMDRTLFSNPTGQDAGVKPMPYSSAMDMARLTRYAIGKAGFRFQVSQKERQISFYRGGAKRDYMLRNTNELLGVEGVDGVKTGRTARAGDCLILSAQRESEIIKQGEGAMVIPRQVIIVLLGSPNRVAEGQQMLNLGWQLYDQWAAGGRMVNPKKTL